MDIWSYLQTYGESLSCPICFKQFNYINKTTAIKAQKSLKRHRKDKHGNLKPTKVIPVKREVKKPFLIKKQIP